MDEMIELWDSKTDRIVFVGTEKECIEYTKKEPERSFYFITRREIKNELRKSNNNGVGTD